MKALLIYPPTLNMIQTNVPGFVNEETGVYPPLGLLYVAAYAQRNTEFEIEVMDCNAMGLSYAQLETEIREKNPDVVGIQVFTFTLMDAINVAKAVKNVSREIHVCMGGPHVNLYPFETVRMDSVDSVVRGEGEYVFADLLNAIADQSDLGTVKGLLYKADGKVVDTGIKPYLSNEELNALPHPARQLLPINQYYSVLAKTNPITTVISSRGCPFQCIFCDRPQMGKSFRFRNADSIVDELTACFEMGIKEFMFYDDTFTINKGRVLELCRKLTERGLNKKIAWDIRSRVDTVDEEMIQMMKTAGCDRIHYGVESGTERVQRILKKGITIKQVEDTFRITKNNGIEILAYFILGNPGETQDEMRQTISFAKKLKPDYVHFSAMVPYPGTELYRMLLKSGKSGAFSWNEFAKNPMLDFTPMFCADNLSRDELIDILGGAYRSFYLRPQYISSQLLKVKSWAEFKRKVKAGLRVVSH